MNCEMCGSETMLSNAMVEGVELKLCKNCMSFGKVINRPRQIRNAPVRLATPEKELVEVIVPEYSVLIREKREKMGLKQTELAKFLSERESLIHKMESGDYMPSIELAKKLEKQLGIKLVEAKELVSQHLKASPNSFTIGDMIKVK